MIRLKVLMIAFRIYIYFHGPLFSLVLMSFVLTTCYPFLSSSTITYSPVLMLFPTCSHGVTIFYHMLTCPSSRIVSYCLHLTHRLLLIAMSSGQISGIGLPFILIMSNPCISKLCIRLSNQPIQQETPRVRLDFLLAPKFRRSLRLTSDPRYRTSIEDSVPFPSILRIVSTLHLGIVRTAP